MKAVYVDENRKLQIIEKEAPVIKREDEVLIKVTSAGICSSDYEIASGTHPFASYPIIIGHEFGGIVMETGKTVTNVSVGDKVTVDPVTSCGSCPSCRRGRSNICLNLKTMGVHVDGGFCEYVVVPAKNVYAFKKQDFSEKLVGIAEPYSIGAQINLRGQIGAEDNVLIMGCGPIGICAMQIAKHAGARVLMTDLLERRMALAKAMGADEVLNPKDVSYGERADKFFDGLGADVVVNTLSYPDSLCEAVERAAFGGRVVVVSVDTRKAAVRQSDLMKKEITITGSRLNNHRFSFITKGFDEGWLEPERLVSHYLHFTEFEKGMEMIKNNPGEICKIGLLFD